jgi:hypothetical protein
MVQQGTGKRRKQEEDGNEESQRKQARGLKRQIVNFCKYLWTVIDKRRQCPVNPFPTRTQHSYFV